MIMPTDRIFAPRKHEVLFSGPWSHWGKLLFEKYYLRRLKTGSTYLPIDTGALKSQGLPVPTLLVRLGAAELGHVTKVTG
jgi:hypothetical protein